MRDRTACDGHSAEGDVSCLLPRDGDADAAGVWI